MRESWADLNYAIVRKGRRGTASREGITFVRRDGGQNSRVGTFARRDGGQNSRVGTFARRDGGQNSREGNVCEARWGTE